MQPAQSELRPPAHMHTHTAARGWTPSSHSLFSPDRMEPPAGRPLHSPAAQQPCACSRPACPLPARRRAAQPRAHTRPVVEGEADGQPQNQVKAATAHSPTDGWALAPDLTSEDEPSFLLWNVAPAGLHMPCCQALPAHASHAPGVSSSLPLEM